MTQTVTLELPGPLYTRLQERATRSRRNVEEESLDLLAAAAGELPPDLSDAMSQLTVFDDESLWRAARVSFHAADRVSELHGLRSERGLSEAERYELDGLLRRADHVMLVRAQAAALLVQRGHDVSALLGS